jgi:hypothetical protein
MSSYREAIIEDTGCNPDDAGMTEHIMREDIFHSTLDWQTRAELRRAARKAAKILAQDRPLYEEYFTKTRAVFEEMRQTAQQNAKA